MKKARDAAALGLDSWSSKVRVFKDRMRMLCDEIDLLKRRESAICAPKVITCRVADPSSVITNLATDCMGVL